MASLLDHERGRLNFRCLLLTWNGLRGGIALSLPTSDFRQPLITATYSIAVLTMIAQGLSLEAVATRLHAGQEQR